MITKNHDIVLNDRKEKLNEVADIEQTYKKKTVAFDFTEKFEYETNICKILPVRDEQKLLNLR